MSGNLAAQTGNAAYALNAFNQLMPNDCKVKAMPITFVLAANVAQEVDLQIPQSRGVIDFVQSIYIDNSANTGTFSVAINSGQTVTVAAGTQGYYPILVPNPPTFNVSATASATVKVLLINVPMPVASWGGSTSTAATSGAKGVAVTDKSGSAADGVYSTLMAANASRTYIFIQNLSAFPMLIKFSGGGAFVLAIGQTYESGPSVTVGAITCAGSGGAVSYTAYEGVNA